MAENWSIYSYMKGLIHIFLYKKKLKENLCTFEALQTSNSAEKSIEIVDYFDSKA